MSSESPESLSARNGEQAKPLSETPRREISLVVEADVVDAFSDALGASSVATLTEEGA